MLWARLLVVAASAVVMASAQLDLGCSLEVVVDPFFVEAVESELKLKDPSAASSSLWPHTVRRSVLWRVTSHVAFVNDIFKAHGIRAKLYLHRIKVLSRSSCTWKDVDYCAASVSPRQLLDLHSSAKHDDVCLAFVFTGRDAEDGALGLAWTATLDANSGGVCEGWKRTTEGTTRSLNTGVVAFALGDTALPEVITQLAFAHEIGHSFGAQHDDPGKCGGSFLMQSGGAKGTRKNDFKLSRCSVDNITNVMHGLETNAGKQCMQTVPLSVCGNGVVEGWEECDCGEDDNDCIEKCCFPANAKDGKPCSLRNGAECSPSEGACCGTSCHLMSRSSKSWCAAEDECAFAAACDGQRSQCPRPMPKPDNDNATCMHGTKMCRLGECTVSVCSRLGLDECVPDEDNDAVSASDGAAADALCRVHCKSRDSGMAKCTPSNILRPAGTVCSIAMAPSSYSSSSEGGLDAASALGFCSAAGECVVATTGSSSLSSASSAWSVVVGLCVFAACYLLLMALALCIYCRYCRGRTLKSQGGGQYQNHVNEREPSGTS